MPIKDLIDEFVMAGQGELNCVGCKMPYVPGPDGNRHWQQLIIWGGHGASNKRFIVNPLSGLDEHLLNGRVIVRTAPLPPGASSEALNREAERAARAVLEAMKA